MKKIMKKYGSKTKIATDINKEPVLKDLFLPKVSSGGNVPISGDILLDLGGVSKILDIVISHPIAQSEPCVADTGRVLVPKLGAPPTPPPATFFGSIDESCTLFTA